MKTFTKKVIVDAGQFVYKNHKLGKSVKEMFSVTKKTVFNIFKRVECEGRLEPKYCGGLKSKITQRLKRGLVRKLDQNPRISTKQLAEELREVNAVVVSHEKVRQTIMKNKYSSRYALKNSLLFHQHRVNRILYNS